jgi:5'-3' exoribonuclease 1
MGIPSYFSYIVKNHRNIIKHYNRLSIRINNLYLDCNSIIYDTLREIKFENKKDYEETLIKKICEKIDYYITIIKPNTIVFIAFDGVAPVAKLEQQRNRRYKSWFQSEVLREINHQETSSEWDSTCITPGTEFMKDLAIKIKKYFGNFRKRGVKQIITSCSDEPGEGEHKIYDYIRKNPEYHNSSETVIYGLDADLIMLTLNHLHISNKLYLFRETPHFIKTLDNTLNPDELYLLDIPELSKVIISDMSNNTKGILNNKEKTDNLLFDYILICFLLGNDFLPHFPSINIRTQGIDILMNAYRDVFKNSNSEENLTNGKRIVWKNLRKFVEKLKDQELLNFQNEMVTRSKWEKKYIPDATPKEKEEKFQLIPIKEREIEKYINPGVEGWEDRYYKMLFNVDIDDERRKEICMNYLEGLEWTIKYYTNGCPDWRWSYKYNYAPLISDLYKYVPYFDNEFIETANAPVNELVQLCYVLPRKSLTLLPKRIYDELISKHSNWYGLDYRFEWSFCKYFWEAHAIMPEIDINKLEEIVGH